MKFLPGKLEGVVIIEPDVYQDDRGFFLESYHARKYTEGGLPVMFVQDNHSRSRRKTLRGLHTQLNRLQGKLVRVTRGEIFDVAVDVRRGSPTFGQWEGVCLSSDNFRQLYIPPGFAHGFCVISDDADVEYKCTDFYEPGDEIAIRWNDPAIGIVWPVQEPLLSEKDHLALGLQNWIEWLPSYKKVQS